MIRKTVILILLILVSICAAGCTQNTQNTQNQNNSQISEDATIIHKTYGAFTLPEMQLQQLAVNKTSVVFTTSDNEGKFLKVYEKPFNESAFSNLTLLFEENGFLQMNNSYTPQEGQPIVTDVGTLEISVVQNDSTKTVKVDPYYQDYMPEGLQKIDNRLLELRAYAVSTPPEEARMIAEDWIKNAPTYRFDGFDLKFESQEALETFPEQHLLVYTFTSRQAGYGDRTGQVLAQVLTPHRIEVTVSEKNVTSAIIDGKWDEVAQKPLQEESGAANIFEADVEENPEMK